jgi:hypothetical protein
VLGREDAAAPSVEIELVLGGEVGVPPSILLPALLWHCDAVAR